MTQKNEFLGTEPVGKLLLKLAVPTVIAQLVNMLYNIVDRIYIGHMPQTGSLALTGLGVCTPIILIVSAFAALVASGGAPRASISMGKGDMQTAEKMLGGCFPCRSAFQPFSPRRFSSGTGICCWRSARASRPSGLHPIICRYTHSVPFLSS